MVMEEGALLLNSLMEAIIINLPVLLEGGFSIISGLITGIAEQLPMLVPTAVTLLLTLVQGLINCDGSGYNSEPADGIIDDDTSDNPDRHRTDRSA